MNAGDAAASLRAFVALRPDAATRQRLAAVARIGRARWPSARAVGEDDLHLTLAFIGELALAEARRLHRALAGLSSPPVEADRVWRLDRAGSFGGTRVWWAGSAPDAVPAWLTGLAHRVAGTLDALGIAFDRRRFVPHVTLLRNLPRMATAAADLELDALDAGRTASGPPGGPAGGPIAWPIDADSLRPRLLITQPPGVRPRYADFDPPAPTVAMQAE